MPVNMENTFNEDTLLNYLKNDPNVGYDIYELCDVLHGSYGLVYRQIQTLIDVGKIVQRKKGRRHVYFYKVNES